MARPVFVAKRRFPLLTRFFTSNLGKNISLYLVVRDVQIRNKAVMPEIAIWWGFNPLVEYKRLASDRPHNCLYVPTFGIIRYQNPAGNPRLT